MPAVPPFLKIPTELLGEQGEHGGGGSRAWLEKLNGVRRAATGGQIRNETTPYPPPTGFLAVPGQATTRPGQLLTIEQAAAGTQHPKAVLTSWAGVNTAGDQQSLDNWTTHHWHDAMGSMEQGRATKNHPGGWFRTAHTV